MGKRRIRNLSSLGYMDIIGYDTRKDRCLETSNKYKIKTFSSFKEVMSQSPNVFIISTPPHLHAKYMNYAIKKNINFFTELNLFSNVVKSIINKTKKKTIIISASSTMRFHPLVKKLKTLLNKNVIGKIFMVNHQVGHYLPNWHPWESHHDFFVSKKNTGGAKELVAVELNWLTYLFSDTISVLGNVRKISTLDVNIDDTYQIILEFKNSILCNMSIDVFSIPSFKETKIIGEKGTINVDFIKGTIIINTSKKSRSVKTRLGNVASGYKGLTPPESLYEEELNSFFKSINNSNNRVFSLNDELKLLNVLDAIEKSSKINKRINITSRSKSIH